MGGNKDILQIIILKGEKIDLRCRSYEIVRKIINTADVNKTFANYLAIINCHCFILYLQMSRVQL